MNKKYIKLIIFILLSIFIVVELIFFAKYNIEKQRQKERLEGQLEMYQAEMEKGYCIDGTEYLYSEKYSKGIEVIKFVKCETLEKVVK